MLGAAQYPLKSAISFALRGVAIALAIRESLVVHRENNSQSTTHYPLFTSFLTPKEKFYDYK